MTAAIWTFRSYAKVNLHLEVMGRRPDGFHDLATVFQTVSLCDRLRLELSPGEGVEVEVRGPAADGVPVDQRNLAARAALEFVAAVGVRAHVRIQLLKRIPAGGGLGGGSSNAAAVLQALDRAFPGRLAAGDLHAIAVGLGSDVAFFLVGGTAVGRGRGERLEPLPELARRSFWLVLPPISAATPKVFAALEPADVSAGGDAVGAIFGARDRWQGLIDRGWNALERPATRAYPELAEVADALAASGPQWVRMSGSGSTFMVGADRDWGRKASGLEIGRLVRVRTVSRHQIERSWQAVGMAPPAAAPASPSYSGPGT